LGFDKTTPPRRNTAPGFHRTPSRQRNAALGFDRTALPRRNVVLGFDRTPQRQRNAALGFDRTTLHEHNAALCFGRTTLQRRNAALCFDRTTLHKRNAVVRFDRTAPHQPNAVVRNHRTALHEHNAARCFDRMPPRKHNVALCSHKTALPRRNAVVRFHRTALHKRNAASCFDRTTLQQRTGHGHTARRPTTEDSLMPTPTWNSGLLWSSSSLWGPASPPPPLVRYNPNQRQRTMKRQPYYPRLLADQPEWHFNYADRLAENGAALGLLAADVTASVNDSRQLGYGLGAWLTKVREFGPGATGELETLKFGTGGTAFELPAFEAPTPPAGLTAVLPGALGRIFKYVQTIKSAPGYTEGLGLLLGIVGGEDTVEHPAPEFSLKTETGDGCHCVKVRFKKFGHYAVVIYSRRGGGGWELLGIDTGSPYEDDRPLLVPGQPEVREYKLRFWDDGEENGDWTDVASITVSP
jgi:hypothetical protein